MHRLGVPMWEIEGMIEFCGGQKRLGAKEKLILRLIREREMLRDFLKIGAREIRGLMWYCPEGAAKEMYGETAKALEGLVRE